MNHQKIYDQLINFRRQNPATGYTEQHHILPKSLGGSNDSSNLVVLTGREHWVAHLLLHKIHKKPQTAHACHIMAMKCKERGISQVRNSRMYEAIRIECAKHISNCNSKHCGQKNSQFGTIWICNVELQKNRKIDKNSPIPKGWIEGRNKWKSKNKKPNREKLDSPIVITNGNSVKRLYFKDQLPIPNGWWQGGLPLTEETKKRMSKYWSGLKRPYRVGLKHNRV